MYTYFPSVSWDSQEKSINIFFHRPGPLRTHCKLQSQMSPDELKRTATPWLMLGTPAQELTATRACRVSQSRVSCFPLINNLEGKARQRLYASLWLETSLDSGPICVKKSIKASKLKFASTNLIVVQQRTRPIHKTLAVPGWKYEIGKKEESSNMSDPTKQPPPYPTQAGAGGFVAPPPYPPQPSGYKPPSGPDQSQPGFGYSNQQVWILFTYLILMYTQVVKTVTGV